jgi:hypothetical protein
MYDGDDKVSMANEGSSSIERTASFVLWLPFSLLLPGWGLAMIVMGFIWRLFLWIATGVVVLAIGVILFAGSSLVTPYLGGRRFS